MKIKITEKNAEKIEQALKLVNGKAERHTYTTADEIIQSAKLAEKFLVDALIPKNKRSGAGFVNESSSEKMPNSYKYKRQTTIIFLQRGSTGWFLTDVQKSNRFPDQLGKFRIKITETQKEISLKNFCSSKEKS